MRLPFFVIFTILLFIALGGCGSEVSKAEIAYKEGRYLEASHAILQAYENSPKQAQAFLTDKGPELITRLTHGGDLLMQNPTDGKAIRYFAALAQVLKDLQKQGAQIPALDARIEEISRKEKQALEIYLAKNYELGHKDFSARRYRESVTHFQAIQAFQPDYKNTAQLLKEASVYAFKTVEILPFVKQADSGIQSPIEKPFMTALSYALTQKKSAFVAFKMKDDKPTKTSTANWLIEGEIDATDEWTPGFVDSEKKVDVLEYSYKKGTDLMTEKNTFSFFVYHKRYKVRIELTIRLIPQQSTTQPRTLTIREEVEEVQVYRDNSRDISQAALSSGSIVYPWSYSSLPNVEPTLNKEYVIKRALDLVADKAADQILRAFEP